jgi:hypothetical protein
MMDDFGSYFDWTDISPADSALLDRRDRILEELAAVEQSLITGQAFRQIFSEQTGT